MSTEKIMEIIENSKAVLKGKEDKIKLVICNLLAQGHTLVEDSPGVGKTTLVKFISKSFGFQMSRIQFTNDILPSDIIGTSIFNKTTSTFDFHKGPIFGELILADELNRAPPKTQSALLQVMEERSISVETNQFELPDYFSVIATQNPHMQIGTFDLPESQLDRFSLKMDMGYPSKDETILLLKEVDPAKKIENTQQVLTPTELIELQNKTKKIHIDDSILELIFNLLDVSRINKDLIPLSNRCGQDLVRASKSWAFLNNRDYVLPDDVHYIFPYVAGHRLVHPENSDISFEHKLAEQVLNQI